MSLIYKDLIQIIEVERIYNNEGQCNVCKNRIYWNPSVINRQTKRLLPLQDPYIASAGCSPSLHRGKCMQKGMDKFVKDGKTIYEKDNFYLNYIILESDSAEQRGKKMGRQDKRRYKFRKEEFYKVPDSWKSHSFEY